MAVFEGWKGNILGGLAIGIGASLLAPLVVPILAGVVKPLSKALIKGGYLLYEKGRETLAEVQEVVEDLVAEAKAEIEVMQASETGTADSERVSEEETPNVQ